MDAQGVAVAPEVMDRVRRAEGEITAVCRELVRIPSENPPGDTSKIGTYVEGLLNRWGFPFCRIEPAPGRVNLVATWDSGHPGKHLVLNGHLDAFPAGPRELWRRDPYSGEIADGRLYGRGVIDMKAGVTASLFTYRFLQEMGGELSGKVSLTLVCDEETFAEHGARHVLAAYPEFYGDALLSGEPGARLSDRGLIWAEVAFATRGGHAAYPHTHVNAIDRAIQFIEQVRRIEEQPSPLPAEIAGYLTGVARDMDRSQGRGAARVVRGYGVTPSVFQAGTKVNMAASAARLEVDIRIPVGGRLNATLAALKQAARATGGRLAVINSTPPSITSPEHPFTLLLAGAAKAVTGRTARFFLGPGCTDARLWRFKGVPAIAYGPSPHTMGATNEFLELRQLFEMTAVHTLVGLEFLKRDSRVRRDGGRRPGAVR